MTVDYPDTFAMFSIHHSDSYISTWGEARFAFYSAVFAGYPTFVFDGLSDNWPSSTWEPNFLARQAVPTDVTISFTATQHLDETFDIAATVCIEPGGVAKTMQVHVVQSLDRYPLSRAYFDFTVMQGIDTGEVTVAVGACEVVNTTITFDPVSWGMFDQMRLTVFAQEALASGPAEVHQAKQLKWPFIEGYVFFDDFEEGDTSAWSAVSP